MKNIDYKAAIELLLTDAYHKEFVVVDGHNQHPAGLNFRQWLDARGLLIEDDLGQTKEDVDAEKWNYDRQNGEFPLMP